MDRAGERDQGPGWAPPFTPICAGGRYLRPPAQAFFWLVSICARSSVYVLPVTRRRRLSTPARACGLVWDRTARAAMESRRGGLSIFGFLNVLPVCVLFSPAYFPRSHPNTISHPLPTWEDAFSGLMLWYCIDAIVFAQVAIFCEREIGPSLSKPVLFRINARRVGVLWVVALVLSRSG